MKPWPGGCSPGLSCSACCLLGPRHQVVVRAELQGAGQRSTHKRGARSRPSRRRSTGPLAKGTPVSTIMTRSSRIITGGTEHERDTSNPEPPARLPQRVPGETLRVVGVEGDPFGDTHEPEPDDYEPQPIGSWGGTAPAEHRSGLGPDVARNNILRVRAVNLDSPNAALYLGRRADARRGGWRTPRTVQEMRRRLPLVRITSSHTCKASA